MTDKDGDYLVRAISSDRQIRALAVRSTGVVREARRRHDTTVLSTAALGRVLTGSLLISAMLKSGLWTELRVEGEGPLGSILAEGNLYGQVRGYVQNPGVELPLTDEGKIDVARGIGPGTLTVRKNLDLKDPYQGSVELISGEIGEDLTYYFTQSEQTPSAVGLGVMVESDLTVAAAGGFIVQLMGGAEDDAVKMLEENVNRIHSVSELIAEGIKPEELLDRLFGDLRFRILAETEVEFRCRCSRERTREMVKSLPPEDLKEVLEEQKRVEIRCQFCNESYEFLEEEAREILDEIESS